MPVNPANELPRPTYLFPPFLSGAVLLVAVFWVFPLSFTGLPFSPNAVFSPYTAVMNGTALPAGGEKLAGDPLSPAQTSRLQPGDIILRRGSGPFSTVIVNVLNEPGGFSHSGVVVRSSEGQWSVIHAISSSVSRDGLDGVQAQSLETFTQDSVSGTTVVTRLRAGRGIRSEIAENALRYLREGHSFDMQFRQGLETGIYCSELIALLLPESVRSDVIVAPGPRGIIRFESFLDGQWFETVADLRR